MNFKTRLFCLQTLRCHLVFEMDALMEDLLGHLIAQFLVSVITVHTHVAQDNCHATTVPRRNADVTARRSRFARKAAVCSDIIASEFDPCLDIWTHGVDERLNRITQNSSCSVEPTLR